MKKVNILVVGSGAIGGFYGGKLSQAGVGISTVCRSDYDTVKTKGFNIKSIWGDFHFMPEQIVRNTSEYQKTADYILVGMKVLPEIDLVKIIRPAVGKNTAIVLIQNGLDIEEPVAQAFPDNEIISGLAFICVSRTAPANIHHLDYGRLVLGHYPNGESEKTAKLAELFNQAGVKCSVSSNVVAARWQKLVWNAPFNPISVLGGGVDTKTMLDSPESALLVEEVMKEVYELAKATGNELSSEIIRQNIDNTYKMEPYKTSMLLDYEAKRPLEVEAILGNAIRIARKKTLAVPYMQSLYSLLKLIDEKNRQ